MSTNELASGSSRVPTTPPPSYEQSTRQTAIGHFEPSHKRQISIESQNLRNSPTNISRISINSLELCTDPQCNENYINNENFVQREVNREPQQQQQDEDEADADRKESIDSTELLISTNMAETSMQDQDQCTDSCSDTCQYSGGACGGNDNNSGCNNDFCDPLMNHDGYCSNETCCNDPQNLTSCDYLDEYGDRSQMSNSHNYQQEQRESSLTPEIISNKSSKEIYKDLAKKWGITCKMSDGCRCMDCQSHYFDCEFDDNEHQKTDGGLGAGTPMFISEVMHGTACTIL